MFSTNQILQLADLKTSRVRALAGIGRSYRTITTSQTLTAADLNGTVFVDTTAGSVTVTLPTAAGIGGNGFTVVKTVAANTLNFATTGGQTINAAAPGNVTSIVGVQFTSDNANYFITN